jgi:predicted nuclease of predicted toxin-antitoxin system
MLSLLLDENISDEIARQVSAKRPDIPIFSVQTWEQSRLRGVGDEEVLRAAQKAALTLVTYDVNTIPLLLVRLANEAFVHGSIIFVRNATIRSNDYSALTRAVIQLYDAESEAIWEDRLFFLPPAH